MNRVDKLKGYRPLKWDDGSALTKSEQELVEAMRKDCWRNGIRKEPMLTRLAFEFAAVVAMARETAEQKESVR